MSINIQIEGSIKDTIDRAYRKFNILFEYSSYLCLIFKHGGYLNIIEMEDMESSGLRFIGRLDESICHNDYIYDDELCLINLIVAEDTMIPIFIRRYGEIDIDALMLDQNIDDIALQIFYGYHDIETHKNVFDMLPRVKCEVQMPFKMK